MKKVIAILHLFVSAVCIDACVANNTFDTGTDAATDSPESQTQEEGDLLSRLSRQENILHGSLFLADSFFDFDPTLDPKLSAELNAQAIEMRIKSQLNGCGSVSRNGATVSVDFGAPPGCTLSNGLQVSGKASLTVTAATGLVVAMTFTDLVVDSKQLTGTLTFTTQNGSQFTVNGTILSSGKSLQLSLQLTGEKGGFIVSGTATETDSTLTTQYKFTSVHYTMGACYPDGGSAEVTKSLLTLKVTFDANTPSTGKVTVSQGRKSYTATLPAYGKCPK